MKYINTKTGEVIEIAQKITKELDVYKIIEASTTLVRLVFRFFMKDRKVPVYFNIGGLFHYLTIEHYENGVDFSYINKFHESQFFHTFAPNEKEARKKLYELLEGKGLLV